MDDILGHLSAMERLMVISRTTMESYRDTKKTVPEIAKELKVSYIIESSIQNYRDTVRLTIQLIDAKKDIHVWSKSFKREFKNIFALESEIAMQIAKTLNTTLSPSEIKQITKKSTENLAAYEFYLKGRFFWSQKTKQDLKRSIYYYEKALELDSAYALAYSGLADTYLHMAGWGWYPRIKGLDKSMEYVQKSLKIDPNIAETHTTLGGLLAYREWKWEEAIEQLKYAIKLKPSYVTTHEYYSQILDVLGKDEEARKEIDIALSLDPYSITINQLSEIYYRRSGDYEKALKKNIENHEVFKNHPLNSSPLTTFKLYVLQKEYDKAYNLLIKYLESDESTKDYSETVKKMYKESGIKGIYKWMLFKDLKKPHAKFFLAEIYVFLGENEKALSLLEECCEERSIWAPYMKNNPFFNDLHSEPGFIALLKKMNMYDQE
jgi:tetratricopeptide (TPR) repeat protein